MEAQRERARSASQFGLDYNALVKVDIETRFQGYEGTEGQGTVVALFRDGEPVEVLNEGDNGVVVLNQTPFYAESGGQVGDTGYLSAPGLRAEVSDTTKAGNAHLHHVIVQQGTLRVGEEVQATVDAGVRQATALNHSATHLLHAALREVLGDHVQQKGSQVDSQRLRFDFSHYEAIKPEQLRALEDRVNEQIRLNSVVGVEVTDIESAKNKGAMALFGEKYGDQVRVLTMGNGFSVELCGGTHVSRTGDIGLFKITAESGIASGVRRIEAVTGTGALAWIADTEERLREAAATVKGSRDNMLDKLAALVERSRQLEKEVDQLKAKAASAAGSDLAAAAQQIGGRTVLVQRVDGQDGKGLMALVDQLKNKLGSAAILLGGESDGKVVLVAGVTKDLASQLKAGDWIRTTAQAVGGKGGGRPDMAQGGGTDVAALDQALVDAVSWVGQQ